MKFILTICFTLITCFAFAQFAIIYDKDGYCNVRRYSEKGDNVIDKLNNGDFVYVFENKGNWANVDYAKNNQKRNGQVYKDRLILISSYPNIPLLTTDKSKTILQKDTLKIIVTQQNFDSSKHRFTYHKNYKDQIKFIDNKKYWGTDGGLPNTEYKSIDVFIGKTKVTLPKSALTNLYEINLYSSQVNHDKENDIIYIQCMNSDGAGGYEVIWKIEKTVYKERYIVYGF